MFFFLVDLPITLLFSVGHVIYSSFFVCYVMPYSRDAVLGGSEKSAKYGAHETLKKSHQLNLRLVFFLFAKVFPVWRILSRRGQTWFHIFFFFRFFITFFVFLFFVIVVCFGDSDFLFSPPLRIDFACCDVEEYYVVIKERGMEILFLTTL